MSYLIVIAVVGAACGWWWGRRKRRQAKPKHQAPATAMLQAIRRHPDPTVRMVQSRMDEWADRAIADRSVDLVFDKDVPLDTMADILVTLSFTIRLKDQEAKEFERHMRRELGDLS